MVVRLMLLAVGIGLFLFFLREFRAKRNPLILGACLIAGLWVGLVGQYSFRMYQQTHYLSEVQSSQITSIVVESLESSSKIPALRVTDGQQIAAICKSLNNAGSYINEHGGFDESLLLRLELQTGQEWGCRVGRLHKEPYGVVLTLTSDNGRGSWRAGYLQSNQLESELVKAGVKFETRPK